MLDIQDITVKYSNKEAILKDFSLKVNQGEILSIVGESGSGKTTVIRSVMGLLSGGGEITKGDILFEGESLLKKTKKQLNEIRGTNISMIFQDSGAMINPNRTIGSQFIEYIRTHENISKKEAYDKAIKSLDNMRLADSHNIMKSYPFNLSGGMRQRVGIAMAMTFEPKLLLADEPTSALDVTTQAQIVRQMMELRDKYNTTIIMVTHNLGVAAYMSDRIIVMKNGEIVNGGDRDFVLNNKKDDYTNKLLDSVPTLGGEKYA